MVNKIEISEGKIFPGELLEDMYKMGLKEYTAVNINPDGEMIISQYVKKLRKEEIEAFKYRTLKIYRYYGETTGMPFFLLRGPVSIDALIDPNLYDDCRIFRITEGENKPVLMLQADVHSGKSTAIRMVNIPLEVKGEIESTLIKMLRKDYSSKELDEAYKKDILSKSPDYLLDHAEYLGSSDTSILTKNLITFW